MSGVTLILGGARSGKSARGLALVESMRERRSIDTPAPIFIATAEAGDDEMAERIARHRAERSATWRVEECPFDLVDALARHDRRDDIVLVDCLTLWLSNHFGANVPIEPSIDALVESLGHASRHGTVLIANEIGLGLVPPTALGRRFRDAHGRMNRDVARVANRVELVVAGLPLTIKSA